MEIEKPLVSIIVITYNSSKYVLETLDSIKSQIYQNIELIISDDCSTDNTVQICKAWLQLHKVRFQQSIIITTPQNTGIPGNCNRGLKAAKGEWIKLIAGDDYLLPNCINDNVQFVNKDGKILVVHSISRKFKNIFEESQFIGEINFSNKILTHQDITPEEQYQILLRGCWINTSTVFIAKSVFEKVGFYDETIPFVEDWPLFLKLTSNGYKIDFLNKVTVNYRVHDNSTFNHKLNENSLHNNFSEKVRPVYQNYVFNHISQNERILENFEYYRVKFLKNFGMNRNTPINRLIDKTTMQLRHRYKFWYLNRIIKGIENRIN